LILAWLKRIFAGHGGCGKIGLSGGKSGVGRVGTHRNARITLK